MFMGSSLFISETGIAFFSLKTDLEVPSTLLYAWSCHPVHSAGLSLAARDWHPNHSRIFLSWSHLTKDEDRKLVKCSWNQRSSQLTGQQFAKGISGVWILNWRHHKHRCSNNSSCFTLLKDQAEARKGCSSTVKKNSSKNIGHPKELCYSDGVKHKLL